MPPTDLVKKLSRSDHIVQEFKRFLEVQGVIRDGLEKVLSNPQPFSVLIPVINGGEVHNYKCFALSICRQEAKAKPSISEEIKFAEMKITSTSRVNHVTTNDTLYILDLNDVDLWLFFWRKVHEIKVLENTFRVRNINLVDVEGADKFSSIFGLSFKGHGFEISLASSDPFVLETRGSCVRLRAPVSNILAISKGRTIVQLFRLVYVYKSLVELEGEVRMQQSIVEVVDPLTIAMTTGFEGGCVNMVLANPYPINFNTMIKAYGYIDEIAINGTSKFKPKHNIVRLSIPGFGRSEVRVCISTSIPKRADMMLRFKRS